MAWPPPPPSDPHHLRPLADLSIYSPPGQPQQPQHQRSPPRVNAGTRPSAASRRKSPRKNNANADDADGGSAGSGGESSGDESGDDYVPPEDPGRDGEEDELLDSEEQPRHPVVPPPHPHAHYHTHHPHPQGLPPLPPDYTLAATQTLTSMASQSQTQPESSFQSVPEGFMAAVDPHTGLPLPPDLSGGDHGSGSGGNSAARGKRGKRHVNDEEWNRQRKDNHKEVERRRRGNINEGINQLAAIVPNSAGGEKAKGAILSRAVTYIHQLKDNEARNIEKWTLEKLLMDQAMGDLQSQLEEYKRRWEFETQARMALEREVEMLKARSANAGASNGAGTAAASEESATTGQKRARVE